MTINHIFKQAQSRNIIPNSVMLSFYLKWAIHFHLHRAYDDGHTTVVPKYNA